MKTIINEDIGLYNFPDWVTEDMKDNFFWMWNWFWRNHNDYESSRIENKLPRNWLKVYLKDKNTGEITKGEIYFKWNNIFWAFDWNIVHHVSSGGSLFEVPDISNVEDYQITFLTR